MQRAVGHVADVNFSTLPGAAIQALGPNRLDGGERLRCGHGHVPFSRHQMSDGGVVMRRIYRRSFAPTRVFLAVAGVGPGAHRLGPHKRWLRRISPFCSGVAGGPVGRGRCSSLLSEIALSARFFSARTGAAGVGGVPVPACRLSSVSERSGPPGPRRHSHKGQGRSVQRLTSCSA